MNTTTLDLAFDALNVSVLSIVDEKNVSKQREHIAKCIDQFADEITGDGFATIAKEAARGEPVIKLIPGLTREQSFAKAAEDDPHEIERQYMRPAPTVPLAMKAAAIKAETALNKAASDILKAEPGLTKEQAFTKALQLDPASYDAAERAKWGRGPQTE